MNNRILSKAATPSATAAPEMSVKASLRVHEIDGLRHDNILATCARILG